MKHPKLIAGFVLAAVATFIYVLSPAPLKSLASGFTNDIQGDINGDGRVDIFDLSILLSNFGKGVSPTPTGTPTTTPTPTGGPITGFVHQSGTQLLDGRNDPVKLRGVNLGGWLSWEGWVWGQGTDYIGETAMMNNLTSLVGASQANQFQTDVENSFITSNDFQAMAADGLNTARVPFSYRLLEDDSQPGAYKPAGWAVLDKTVQAAQQNHVYLVMDMHVAPCSENMGFTEDYVGGPNFLWWTPTCQDRAVALWKAIATRYANANIIAGYDLINESVTSNQNLLSLYQRLTTAIRQVDNHHLLIYEGNTTARDFGLFISPLDSNEMLSFHDYAWESSQDVTTRLPGYDAAAKTINAPQWAGEFGQSTYSNIMKYVQLFNADPLISGYTDWTWKQSPGFPSEQTINKSAAAQKLIFWINNPSRPKPSSAEAQQGMSDFINEIQFNNTTHDPQMQSDLAP